MPENPNASLAARRHLALGAASALAVLTIWTAFLLIGRASAARTLAPLDIAWLRFLGAGLVVLPLLAWRGRALFAALGGGGIAWRKVAALTATAGLGYCVLAYSAFFFAPAAHAAVLMPGTLPLWTALLAVAVLGERLGPWKLAGLALILCGGALVGGASIVAGLREGSRVWIGDLLFMAAAVSWALYGVLCRRWRVGAVDATMAIALGGLLVAVPVYPLLLALTGLPSGLARAPWGEIAFQTAFQGGVAMWLAGLAFTQVVASFGPLRASMLTSLVPPATALLAVPLLGEPLQAAALWGLACVTVGFLLGLRAAAAPPAALPVAAR